jgi:hypothetical protein
MQLRLRDLTPEHRRALCETISRLRSSDEWHLLAAEENLRWGQLWNLFAVQGTPAQKQRRGWQADL